MCAEKDTDTAVRGVDDEDWKRWKSRFTGKLVVKAGPAAQPDFGLPDEGPDKVLEIGPILSIERGRALSDAERTALESGGIPAAALAPAARAPPGAPPPRAGFRDLEVLLARGQARVPAQVPAEPDALLDQLLDELEQENGNTEEYIPYWLQLWPSALVLADELAAGRVAVDGARVAEISAGLGLPGVTAGVCGASSVTMTEYDPRALPVLADNAARAGLEAVDVQVFDWFAPTGSDLMLDLDCLDVVCLADVMYEERFLRPVGKVIKNLLQNNRGSQCLFTDPQRPTFSAFREHLCKLGLKVEGEVRSVTLHSALVGRPMESSSHAVAILKVSLPE